MSLTRSCRQLFGWRSPSRHLAAISTESNARHMAVHTFDDSTALDASVDVDDRIRPRPPRSTSDTLCRVFGLSSCCLPLGVMALIGLFLFVRSWKALRVAGFGFFT